MDRFTAITTSEKHITETSLSCKADSKMCAHPPIVWGFYGKGFQGFGRRFPSADIRGFKFGSAARKLLLSLPSVDEPPVTREGLEKWVAIESPAQRKVSRRLYIAGLIWLCKFYEFRGISKPKRLAALTPLGGKVLEFFGDDMRNNRRIRWHKWTHPSVAATPPKWEQFISGFNDLVEAPEKPLKPSEPLKQYGNSMDYLVWRIARDELIWNSGGGYGFGFSFDYSLPNFLGFSEVK